MRSSQPRDIALSDAEWRIMRCLWQSGEPSTAREVLERLPASRRRWAYTTVKTMLDRLAAKGAVAADRSASTTVYRARVQEADARRRALKSLLDRAFDGAVASLLGFMGEEGQFSARDRRELEALLLPPNGATGVDRSGD